MPELPTCIICGRTLENVGNADMNQPSGGTAFTSQGHYGSTVFDPMDGTFLEINICDDDLRAAAKKGQVLFGRPDRPVHTPPHYELFEPYSG